MNIPPNKSSDRPKEFREYRIFIVGDTDTDAYMETVFIVSFFVGDWIMKRSTQYGCLYPCSCKCTCTLSRTGLANR